MVRSWLGRAVLVVAMAVLGACGGGDDSASGLASVAGAVGPQGGVVTTADGAEVVIPPKAFVSEVDVSIRKDSTGAPPLPPNAAAAGSVYMITPHGGDFQRHVEVVIPVERTQRAANEQLVLVTAQPGDTHWTILSAATFSNGKLRAPVMHFSFFQPVLLVNTVVPSVTTTISDGLWLKPKNLQRTNNVGGPGIVVISPDHEFRSNLDQPYNFDYSSMVLEARVTYAPLSGATSPTICRPQSLAHDGSRWRILRNGTAIAPAIRHQTIDYFNVIFDGWDSAYPGQPRRTLRSNPDPATQSSTLTPDIFSYRAEASGFGAIHFYGDSAVPPRGPMLPVTRPEDLSKADLWPSPPPGNIVYDDTYVWTGMVQFDPTQHNGQIRIETVIPTDCNFDLEPAPIGFRLNLFGYWGIDRGAYVPTGYMGVYALTDRLTVANGDTATLPFKENVADSSFSIRWEYSTDAVNWQANVVPPERIQAGPDEPIYNGFVQTHAERPYNIVIHNVQPRDAGFYRAWACAKPSGAYCISWDPMYLRVVTDPPQIAKQPMSVTVNVGERATFMSDATVGVGPWDGSIPAGSGLNGTVKWQKRSVVSAVFNTGDWVDLPLPLEGYFRLQYTTPPTTASDTGYLYRMVITNSLGTTASEPALLTVVDDLSPPVIAGQPADINVVAGSTASFVATVAGGMPMNYQWRKDGTNIPGANSATYTLNNVSAADEAGYDLVVTNRSGVATSNVARLTVTASNQPLLPQILAAPASITVAEGNAANFAVAVSGTGPFTYQWLKDGSPIVGGTSAAFGISPVALSDAGQYRVRITNAAGSVTSAPAVLSVTQATGAPTAAAIVMSPIGLAVAPGSGATLAVAVTGTAPFTYQWMRNGSVVPGATGPMLNFPTATALDAGQYTVTVSNAVNSVTSAPAQLVLIGAPTIIAPPNNATAGEAQTATFGVTATGDALRYQWLRNGSAIAGATASTYTTPSLVIGDNGAAYSVIVYNTAGVVVSTTATLTVTPTPPSPTWSAPDTIVTADIDVNVAAGIDGSKRSLAIWPQLAGFNTRIVASRGQAGGSWGAGVTIDNAVGGSGYEPQLGVAASGQATAIWGRVASSRYGIAAARFDGTSWGAAEVLDDAATGNTADQRVAVDDSGRAAAVWQRYNGTRYVIRVRLNTGGGWAAAVDLDPGVSASQPQVAVNAQGKGFVSCIVGGAVVAAPIDLAAGTIGTPVTAATSVTAGRSLADHRLAVDASGGAIVAWIEDMAAGGYDLRASRFDGTGWAPAEAVQTNVGFRRDLGAAAGGAGQFIVAWVQQMPNGDRGAYSRRNLGGAWEAVRTHSAPGQQRPEAVQVAMAASGRVVVAWTQRDATDTFTQAWANAFTGTWDAPQPVQPAAPYLLVPSLPLATRSLALGSDGTALLLWSQNGSPYSLRGAYFQ